MTNILAIETSTDACSVALYSGGETREIFEIIPRQHSQRLFPMLRELLPNGNLVEQKIDAIAYACGPGSFTGLRIAASAVQGLAFANGLPAIAVSTLACQAQAALRLGDADSDQSVLSVLDARINEVYWSVYEYTDGLAKLVQGPHVCAPQNIKLARLRGTLAGVGGGLSYFDQLPQVLQSALQKRNEKLLPSAVDLIPQALASYAAGEWQTPAQVLPVYVREEVSWKKLAEQGKGK